MNEPLVLTQDVRDISVTERQSFKTCRRQWYLSTIQNLEPRGAPNWAYDFGTGLHKGLEAYYLAQAGMLHNGPDTPLGWAHLAMTDWAEDYIPEVKAKKLGNLEFSVIEEVRHYEQMGKDMLEYYDMFAKPRDDFSVAQVEGIWTPYGEEHFIEEPVYGEESKPIRHPSGRILCPIVDPDTNIPFPGPIYLSAKIDLLVWRSRPGVKGLWIIDHKSASQQPTERAWDFDDQATGYSYIIWRMLGKIPRGMIPNYLVKTLPKEPRLIRKDTALSTAKDQHTLPEWYKEAAIEFKLADTKGNWFSKDHADCYNALLSHGWNRYFRRFEVQRNTHELMSFEKRLFEEVKDMREVRGNPDRAYPNPSIYMNCAGCSVAPICQAMEDGSDVEDIISNRFQQAKDRKAEE